MSPTFFKLFESSGSRQVALFDNDLESSWIKNVFYADALRGGWDDLPKEVLVPITQAVENGLWIYPDTGSQADSPKSDDVEPVSVKSGVRGQQLLLNYFSKVIRLCKSSDSRYSLDDFFSISSFLRCEIQDSLLSNDDLRKLYLACLWGLARKIQAIDASDFELEKSCELTYLSCQIFKFSRNSKAKDQSLQSARFWRRASYTQFMNQIKQAESADDQFRSIVIRQKLLRYESTVKSSFEFIVSGSDESST